MRVRIHRGAHEIGGSCVESKTEPGRVSSSMWERRWLRSKGKSLFQMAITRWRLVLSSNPLLSSSLVSECLCMYE